MATSLTAYFQEAARSIVLFLPLLIAAIIILLIGWIIGRLLGKIVYEILVKTKIDQIAQNSKLGKGFDAAGFRIAHLFDYLIRIAVYLVAILAAVQVLGNEALVQVVFAIVSYVPSIVAFIVIIIAGVLLVDYFGNFMTKVTEKEGVVMRPVILVIQIFFYVIVIILAMTQLRLDLTILYTFLVPVAWGLGIGLGAAIAIIIGFGLKDRAPEIMDKVLQKGREE